MNGALVNFALGLTLAPVATLFWWNLGRMIGFRINVVLSWVTGCIGGGISCLLDRDWWWLAGCSLSALAALAIWWWRRKKRRNVAALLGQKSRALRGALVRKVREITTPRPVLRPVPVPR